MRTIVMFNRVSADGYFSGSDGDLDWVVPEEQIDKDAAQASQRGDTDTILFGRRTYQMFESFWPHALDDSPAAPDPHGRKRTPEMRAMAVMLNEATKIVFSRTLKQVTWKNSRLEPAFDAEKVRALKQGPGKGIIVFGSGSIVSQLTEHGLIDEYRLAVSPVFLGQGKSLIADVSKRVSLKLADCTRYPSGNVMLRYTRS